MILSVGVIMSLFRFTLFSAGFLLTGAVQASPVALPVVFYPMGTGFQETADFMEMLTDPAANQPELSKSFSDAYEKRGGFIVVFENSDFTKATFGVVYSCKINDGNKPENDGKFCTSLTHYYVLNADKRSKACPNMDSMKPMNRLNNCYEKKDETGYGSAGYVGSLMRNTYADALHELQWFVEENATNKMGSAIQKFSVPMHEKAFYGCRPNMAYAALRGNGYSIKMSEPTYWVRSGNIDATQAKLFDASRALEEAGLVYMANNTHCDKIDGPAIMTRSDFEKAQAAKKCVMFSMGELTPPAETMFEKVAAAGFKYEGNRWVKE